MNILLQQFLEEEALPHVRNLIMAAIIEQQKRPGESRKKYEFNRFEVTLDYVHSIAEIQDILDHGESGQTSVSFKELMCLLS
jgi:hypothetical protein